MVCGFVLLFLLDIEIEDICKKDGQCEASQ